MNRFSYLAGLLIFCGYLFCSCTNCNRPPEKNKTNIPEIKIPEINEIKPVYNIYLENSGSMDGFVKGVTDFEHAIYNLLVDITNNHLADSINLNYINSVIIPNNPDIADFIENLEPENFRQKGGNRSSSNMSNIFKTILNRTYDNCVSVFISDCVFSPGSGADANEYLVKQQIAIKDNFAQRLDQINFTTIVFQLNSQFNGSYYNRLNQPVHLSGNRPYFIWMFGKHEFIADLLNKIKPENFKGGGVKNFYCMYNGEKFFSHGIMISPRLGTYERDKKNPGTSLIKARKADKGVHKGKFQFSLGVDYKKSLLIEDFISDTLNYEYPANYNLEIIKCNITGINYSHILKLTTGFLRTETVNIRFINSIPGWITEITSEDDQFITSTGENDKSFGFSYLVEGIYEAYKMKNNGDNKLYEINISVNQ